MKFASLLIAASLIVPATASATSLVDGSFEIQGAATPVTDYCYSNFSGVNPQCAPGAWGTQGGVIHTGSGPWGGTTTPDGNYYGMLQQNQVLAQTFTATATTQLVFGWLDANRTNTGGAHSYTVTISDGTATTTLGTYTSGFGGFVAKSASPYLVAAGGNYTLSFNGIYDGGDTTSFIDAVSISAVPEPATWGLMLAGFALVGFAARARRTAFAA